MFGTAVLELPQHGVNTFKSMHVRTHQNPCSWLPQTLANRDIVVSISLSLSVTSFRHLSEDTVHSRLQAWHTSSQLCPSAAKIRFMPAPQSADVGANEGGNEAGGTTELHELLRLVLFSQAAGGLPVACNTSIAMRTGSIPRPLRSGSIAFRPIDVRTI